VQELGTMFLDLKEDDAADKTGQRYVYMLKALADYNLTLTRYTRQATISMLGHRWLVPGFPAVILRKNGSYIAYVKAHRFSVDANGQETSAVDLDYVRPLPAVYYAGATSNLRKMDEALLEVRSAAQKAREAYDALATELRAAYDAAQAAYVQEMKGASGSFYNPLAKLSSAARSSWLTYAAKFGPIVESIDPLYLTTLRTFSGDPASIKTIHNNALSAIANIKARVSTDDTESISELPIFGDTRIASALSALKEAVTKYGAVTSSDTPLRQYFAFPPLFANEDLIKKETAEGLYASLLGTAKNAYTQYGAGGDLSALGAFGGISANMEIAYQNQKAYTEYLSFLDVLAKIFPIGVGQQTMWGERIEQVESLESVRDWEERDILRRTGTQSLGSFAVVHKLRLSRSTSTAPSPTEFYLLRPEAVTDVNGRMWDDTLFSCIVDEKAFAGEGSDPEIKKLRESVTDAGLITMTRQEYWIEYARKHWGSRAHDLS
jgi:hypothetical protein